ncbi:hypothetical protein [Algoriphagus limi]|uniref:Uncharacterized protein n=1 Tax=Algoriphagus limi TaxID=2975273 RepID=A0ABT2G4A7_9BACT|nr:hypothetical protein [Algoriphagus limi]MCS5488875.1 hypothetical protein [Algoriphagus limi]
MSIFTRLFGRKTPIMVEQQSQASIETMESNIPQIDKSLFIEDMHPDELFTGEEADKRRSKKSILEDLKSRDYYAMGMRDGLDDPNFETMDQNVNLIACDFKEVYSQAIQEIDEQLLKIDRTLVPQFEEQMPFEYREVKLQKERLEEQKWDLKQQFDLATVGEGYIEKSVERYKAGFKKGFRQWSNENLMFKPFNTL